MIPTARNVLAHLPIGTPRRAISPGERLLGFSTFALRGAARLSFTARIERTPFNRARSASTKDDLADSPSCSSQATRCASTAIIQLPSLLFQHPA